MRQHVNPLSRFFQLPLVLEDSSYFFENNKLPIHIDIGSARGQFLINQAVREPFYNYLGVEIRKTLVDSAEKKRNELALTNLKFVYCNANISLDNWIVRLRNNQLQRVSIQFPDPYFKRRHLKRRVLQESLLNSIAKNIKPGGELFIQSDVLNVIESISHMIEKTNYFKPKIIQGSKLLNSNPYDSRTEREIYAMKNNLSIYRLLYIRNDMDYIDE